MDIDLNKDIDWSDRHYPEKGMSHTLCGLNLLEQNTVAVVFEVPDVTCKICKNRAEKLPVHAVCEFHGLTIDVCNVGWRISGKELDKIDFTGVTCVVCLELCEGSWPLIEAKIQEQFET